MEELRSHSQAGEKELREDDGRYTAIAYDDDFLTIAAQATYYNEEEAIRFAKSRNWDEVRNEDTGETIWSRQSAN